MFELKTSCIASHLHYNNVSCILRCVFTLLQTCVLVGLDWAEPMMFLLLHITCSCIRSIHSLYSYTLNCFGTFLIVSFSPSLFCLCQSASMAPKCKSTPSQNLLRSRASTSFDPTPFHVQFCDEKAKLGFFENFSRQGIHSECEVILSNFSDTDLPTVIYSRE